MSEEILPKAEGNGEEEYACQDNCTICCESIPLILIALVAIPIIFSPALIVLGAGFGITFGVKNLRNLHLAAKISIPIITSSIIALTEIAFFVFLIYTIRSCIKKSLTS